MFFIIDSEARRSAALKYLSEMPLSRSTSVEIKDYHRNRTKSQNRLYWMWVHIIAPFCGYDEEELHLILREQFLGYEVITIRGQQVLTLKSTTELSTKQMTAYLDLVGRLAYFLDIALPYPDDADYAMER